MLPDDHVCNKGDIVRALNCVLQNCNQKPPRPQPENAGKPWTEEQDRELCGLYDSRTSIRQLSKHFKRTTGAITARLVRLGKIQEREQHHRRGIFAQSCIITARSFIRSGRLSYMLYPNRSYVSLFSILKSVINRGDKD